MYDDDLGDEAEASEDNYTTDADEDATVDLDFVAAVAAVASKRRTLRRGTRSGWVLDLQRALNDLMGSELKADGRFGAKTSDVVKIYQDGNGLDPDGFVGTETWTYILADSIAG